MMVKEKGFWSNNHRPGFRITFSNGYTASVQWGKSNDCSRRSPLGKEEFETLSKFNVEGYSEAHSEDAEVAFFDPDGNIVHESVGGYRKPEEVIFFLDYVSSIDPRGTAYECLTPKHLDGQ